MSAVAKVVKANPHTQISSKLALTLGTVYKIFHGNLQVKARFRVDTAQTERRSESMLG